MERSRRGPRYTLEARVEGHAHYKTDVRVLDLSPNGALVASPRYLEEGSELTVQLVLENKPLSVRARVVHCTPDGIGCRAGVQFVSLPAEERDGIRRYLQNNIVEERREQPRIFVSQRAALEKEIELRVLNLSLFGGLFSVRFPLEFGSEHDFVFELPQGEVRVRGVVRHCEAWARARDAAIFRLGVEFTDLSGPDRESVEAYLEDQIQAS